MFIVIFAILYFISSTFLCPDCIRINLRACKTKKIPGEHPQTPRSGALTWAPTRFAPGAYSYLPSQAPPFGNSKIRHCCTVLYCTVLYCTVLYGTVRYCALRYGTVRYCTVLFCMVLYGTVRYCTVLYCTVLFCAVLIWFSPCLRYTYGYTVTQVRLFTANHKKPNLLTRQLLQEFHQSHTQLS